MKRGLRRRVRRVAGGRPVEDRVCDLMVEGLFDSGVDTAPDESAYAVLSLAGDVALADGDPKVHAHVVLGRRDGAALALIDLGPAGDVSIVERTTTAGEAKEERWQASIVSGWWW
jgi:hypothetical protein